MKLERRWGYRGIASCLLLLPMLTSAEELHTDWERQVRLLLADKAETMNLLGNSRSHQIHIEKLYDGRSDIVWFTLRRGHQYTIIGQCDQDCRDLDFGLYDESDNLVDEDVEVDDFPVVTVTPRWSGRFRLKVTMADCRNSPCWWGVGVFRQD